MRTLFRGPDLDSDKASQDSPEIKKEISFSWGIRIPMRDGITLNGTLYKPKGDGATPLIVTITPYIADSYHERAPYFAQRGYAFILVDCRGRGNSGGQFEPFVHDGQDGHDIVTWLAQQSWCNGNVAMWGGSYGGFNQWMTLKEFPPALKSIVPAAAAHPGVDFPIFKNIFFPFEMAWLTLVSGVTPNQNLYADNSFWQEKFYELYTSNRPFREFDQIVGNPSPTFQTFLQHPTTNEYWQQWALRPEDYRQIDIPILTITGQHDGDQPGALGFYQRHMQYGTPKAVENHFLLIGPWDHAGTRTPQTAFGGLEFGEASLVDLNQLHQEWYDWTMSDGPKPQFLQQRVAYYVAGEECWKYVNRLEDITAGTKPLYLNSVDGQANDVFLSGELSETVPADSKPDSYIYDPLDGRPVETQRIFVKDFLTSQHYVFNLFGNGLVYHTPPFDSTLEISGFLKLILWMAIDVPDTDFHALIYEITQDGSSILLAEDIVRARYRESLAEEKLVTPGEINRYLFDGFNFISRRIAKGSRLRLLIKSPGSIHFQKNFNGGGVVADESGEDARTAHVTLYHNASYPSRLELPIGLDNK